MVGAAHGLNAMCTLWEPQLVENERGGVMVVITALPNVRGHLGYWRGAWLWRADAVDGAARVVKEGEPLRIGVGRDLERPLMWIRRLFHSYYVELLTSPRCRAAPAQHSGYGFVSEALWQLDGLPPLHGRPPSLYRRDWLTLSGTEDSQAARPTPAAGPPPPPPPPAPPAPPAGWYADPHGTPGQQRYWDGTRWTEHTRGR